MRTLYDTHDIVDGSADGPRKVNLFETPNVFLDVHILRPGQTQKVHTHAAEDKAYMVLSGRPTITCGDEEEHVMPGQVVFCPQGVPHGARNEGDEDARLLVMMAPHPRPARPATEADSA